ncbi:MAG: response regulator [Planctomycetes bacterium]|nr:response regulator [Planctomycetota bacterium]
MSQSLRIIVADDEPDMRDFFERMLPRLGHQVVALAETGRELVEHCRALQPDLVITDIKMPEMDGIEASQLICSERPIPVILVSAYHDPELVQRAEANHVMAYLVKPIGKTDLGPTISLAVHRFAELQSLKKEAADLRQALADRPIIERAKGLLMKVAGVDEKVAFRRLQELAADRNEKLIEAAQRVLSMEKTLRPAGD